MAMAGDYKEIFGVKIWKNPPQSVLEELEVLKWKTFECPPSKIPWTFDQGSEKMYFAEGKVRVFCAGHDDEPFEIGKGDFVEFPSGMSILWDAIEDVKKHYLVEKK
ncbi:hypothetical protein Ancab_022029 [Ancistrocladus abbreviatus]